MLGRRLAWWFVANLLCLVGLSSAQWFPAVLKLFTTTTSVSQGEDADDAVIKGPKRESRSYWRRHAKQIFFMQTATSDQSSNERVDQGLYVSNADVELYRERKRLLAKELQSQVEDREVDNYANPSTSSNARLRGRQNWPQFLKALPEVSLRCDPVINFKLKQRLSYLGACVTVGLDYLSDLAQWRAFCAVEDTLLHGRFSLKGSELSWAKSFHINLGLGEDAAAKFKLRCGYNLNTHKVYARLRFRAEPLSCFDIAEGISAAGKLPLPGTTDRRNGGPLSPSRTHARTHHHQPTPPNQDCYHCCGPFLSGSSTASESIRLVPSQTVGGDLPGGNSDLATATLFTFPPE